MFGLFGSRAPKSVAINSFNPIPEVSQGAGLAQPDNPFLSLKTVPEVSQVGLTDQGLDRTVNTSGLENLRQPRQGMFGKAFSPNGLQAIGATMQDVGAAIDGRQPGALQALAQYRETMLSKQRKQDAFAAAYDPQTGKFDMARYVAASGGEVPDSVMAQLAKPEDPLLEERRNYLEAQAEAQRQQAAAAEALAEQREVLTPAQFAAYEALAGQRSGAEAYQRARAAQPYAPQRASGGGSKPEAPRMGPRKVTSQSEYAALPSGTTYIAPDGSTRTKR